MVSKIHLDDMVSFFGWHRENSFLATALDNFDINIIDTATQTVVRKFTGHRGPVTDMTFSPDSRWLVTSAMDSTIRTWDIPTSSMVDILKVRIIKFVVILNIFVNLFVFRLRDLVFH